MNLASRIRVNAMRTILVVSGSRTAGVNCIRVGHTPEDEVLTNVALAWIQEASCYGLYSGQCQPKLTGHMHDMCSH